MEVDEVLSFECDYNNGAHRKILERLLETNDERVSGYGADPYCELAKGKIKKCCENPEAEVHFLTGGTQTNQVVIDSLLTKYQGVIAAETGHISAHEAGAIEFTGHKVLTLPQKEGKIKAENVDNYVKGFYEDSSFDHMVFPGMVYISHPTEYGTLYTLEELTALSEVCRKHGLPLFMDGARLGYGLMSEGTDVTLPDVARLCDVFYIGGTKVGALCGEAVVFTHHNTPKHFFTSIKQHGALVAKGRLLGVQFDALFTDDLYFEISRHAIQMAEILKEIFRKKGYRFFLETPTNQIFVVLDNQKKEELKKQVNFSQWEKADDNHTVVRFATSWATTMDEIEALEKLL